MNQDRFVSKKKRRSFRIEENNISVHNYGYHIPLEGSRVTKLFWNRTKKKYGDIVEKSRPERKISAKNSQTHFCCEDNVTRAWDREKVWVPIEFKPMTYRFRCLCQTIWEQTNKFLFTCSFQKGTKRHLKLTFKGCQKFDNSFISMLGIVR